jgi:hypothetical protein
VTLRTFAAGFAPMMLASIAAFIAVHGVHMTDQTLFAPYNFDDFNLLWQGGAFSLRYERLITTNILNLIGPRGEFTYYVAIFALLFSYLSLLGMLATLVVGIEARIRSLIMVALFGSLAWFSTASSAEFLQHTGLLSNGLSLFFGTAAAIVLLYKSEAIRFRGSGKWRGWTFFLLCVASAFSKEDMVVFLVLCVVLGSLRAGSHPLDSRTRSFAVAALVPLLSAYALAFCHIKIFGSSFVGVASGVYAIQHPLDNVARNLPFYLSYRRSTRFLFGILACAALFATVMFWRSKLERQTLYNVYFVAAAPIALIFPYLFLNRMFESYFMNYIPAICFMICGALIAACGQYFGDRRVVGGIAAAGACLIFALAINVVDAAVRYSYLDWLERLRNRSLFELYEVKRARDLGLSRCETVLVQGSSEAYGPFRAQTDRYLAGRFGLNVKWRIEVRDANFLKAMQAFDTERWQFVAAGTDPTKFTCRLKFDEKALVGTLFVNGVPVMAP